jgi:hypothetical protein
MGQRQMGMCDNDSAELKAIYDSILTLLERQSFEDSCHVLVHVLSDIVQAERTKDPLIGTDQSQHGLGAGTAISVP